MFHRILLGTDFGPSSEQAEEIACQLARVHTATVVVLHAIEPINPGGDPNPFADFYESLRAEADQQMAALIGRMRQRGIECEPHVCLGSRAVEIVETANREGVDLIVVGARAVKTPPAPLATTSHRVVRASEVPILVIPAKTFIDVTAS